MDYKLQCNNCFLNGQKCCNCENCTIDFNNSRNVIQHLKEYRQKYKRDTANTVVQINTNNIKVRHYKDEFKITGNHSTGKNRTRKFKYIDKEETILAKKDPNDPNTTYAKLFHSLDKSRKRALDVFHTYGDNNNWQWFFTLTFDPRKVASTIRKAVLYAWQLIRQKFQYYYPGIKILCVVEYHKDGSKMHFHSILGEANISKVLVKAIDNQPYKKVNGVLTSERNPHYLQPIIGEFGEQAYNLKSSFCNLGFSTVYYLQDRTQTNDVSERITRYVAKYMNKDTLSVPYNGKRYFATRNLSKGLRVTCDIQDIQAVLTNAEDMFVAKHSGECNIVYIKNG